MTSTKGQDTLMPELLKLITSNGADSMREVFPKLLNEAMKVKKVEALGAELYERTPDRSGYANEFKPKTRQTRMGRFRERVGTITKSAFYQLPIERR